MHESDDSVFLTQFLYKKCTCIKADRIGSLGLDRSILKMKKMFMT